VVVVARHDDYFTPSPERAPDSPHDGLGGPHRSARTALDQLDDVTQQHQPVRVTHRTQQRVEGDLATQHITRYARAQMQIRNDERAHLPYFAPRTRAGTRRGASTRAPHRGVWTHARTRAFRPRGTRDE
jgi:hypothetical protein